MDEGEWIVRCSARLHAQWPGITRELRDEVAGELYTQDRWRCCEPEQAAAEWLAQGLPDTSAGEAS
jgi:hypothetical protein